MLAIVFFLLLMVWCDGDSMVYCSWLTKIVWCQSLLVTVLLWYFCCVLWYFLLLDRSTPVTPWYHLSFGHLRTLRHYLSFTGALLWQLCLWIWWETTGLVLLEEFHNGSRAKDKNNLSNVRSQYTVISLIFRTSTDIRSLSLFRRCTFVPMEMVHLVERPQDWRC